MPPKPPRLTPEAAGQMMREVIAASQKTRLAGEAAVKNPPRPGAGEVNLNPGEEQGFFSILNSALKALTEKVPMGTPEGGRATRLGRELRNAQGRSNNKSSRAPSIFTGRDESERFPIGDLLDGGFEPEPRITMGTHPGQEFIGPQGQSYTPHPPQGKNIGSADLFRDPSVRGQGAEEWVYDPKGEYANPISGLRHTISGKPGKMDLAGNPWVRLAGGAEGSGVEGLREAGEGRVDPLTGEMYARGLTGAATGTGALGASQGSAEASNLARSATETDLLSQILANPAHKFMSDLMQYTPDTSDEEAVKVVDSARAVPARVLQSIKDSYQGVAQGGPSGAILPGIQGLSALIDPIFHTGRRGQKLISEHVGGIPGAALATLPDAILSILGGTIGKGLPKATPGARAPGRGLVGPSGAKGPRGTVEGASPIYPLPVAGGAPVGPEGIGQLLGGVAKPGTPPVGPPKITSQELIRLIMNRGGQAPSGGAGARGIVPGMPENPSYMAGAHAREGPPTLSQYRNVNPEDFKYYPFKDTNQVAGRDVGIVSEWPYPGISTLRPSPKRHPFIESHADVPGSGLAPGSYDIPGIPVEEGGDPFLKELGGAYGNMSGAVYERLRPLFEKLYQGPAGPPKPLGP